MDLSGEYLTEMKRNEQVKLHVYRLTLMMGKLEPCKYCPGIIGFSPEGSTVLHLDPACYICLEFIGLKMLQGSHTDWWANCPCAQLGNKEALSVTRKYLKLWDEGKHPMQQVYRE